MATQWERDENCAQLLWRAHKGDVTTLARPYQDLHDAARALQERFQDLYHHHGPRAGVHRGKVDGDGLVLDDDTRERVERALARLAARRIWSARRAVPAGTGAAAEPGTIHALLERFPALRDESLAAVAGAWLAPAHARGRCVAGREDDTDGALPALPAALQLRVGAADAEEEAAFLDYLQFVHAVAQRWLVSAARGSFHALDFDAIQEHAHQAWGGLAAREIVYARQLVGAQLLELVRLDADYEDIVFSVAVPHGLDVHIAPATSAVAPSTALSWIAESEGGAHPVHFQLPRAPCPRLRATARVVDDRLHIVEIDPCGAPPSIREPYSLLVLGWGVAAGAAAAQLAAHALPCGASEQVTVLAAVAAMCGGAMLGLWTGGGLAARLRARRAARLFRAWTCDSDALYGGDSDMASPRLKRHSL